MVLLATALAAIALLSTWGSDQNLPSIAYDLSNKATDSRRMAQIWSASGSIVGCIVASFLALFLTRRISYFLMAATSLGFCSWLFWATPTYGSAFFTLAFIVGAVTASFMAGYRFIFLNFFPHVCAPLHKGSLSTPVGLSPLQ